MSDPHKGINETFARFLEDPSRATFRDLMRDHVGETQQLEFKEEWITGAKLAKFVLALANSGGGCVVMGMKEADDGSLEPVGLPALKDKADITNDIMRGQLPEAIASAVVTADFAYKDSDYGALAGKNFQVVIVPFLPDQLPLVAEKNGDGIREGSIYVRRQGKTQEASHSEVQKIINDRLATGHSTAATLKLEEHLDQLQVLQDRIPKTLNVMKRGAYDFSQLAQIRQWSTLFGGVESKPNPNYPTEDAAGFILRVFEAKKKRIMREIEVD